ncbi:MAG: ester cyclase [Bacteroidota bacterium]|nr:ester cyclase [Bacteroidota bacterium]
MKKTKLFTTATIGIWLLVLITSCKSEPSQECIPLKTANEQLAANLKMYETTWNEIINKGKLDLINETNFDKSITLISSPKKIVGIEGFKAYYKNYLTGFSNITFTIVDAFGQGDKIVKHWNFKGKHTGDFFGIPATGKDVNVDGVTLVRMKNGKIAQEQDFLDNLEFMQQLGIIPRQ